MSKRPSLTKIQLQEIQHRRKGDADIVALLWEVARLRRHVMRARQVLSMIYTKDDTLGMIANQFREEIKDEAVIIEFDGDWAARHDPQT
jgi:hypothetical protein